MGISHNLTSLIDDLILALLLKKAKKFRSEMEPMAIFSHDFIGNEINVTGFYERAELESLAEILNEIDKGLTVLDIGANIGNHSRFLHQQGFKTIHAFEPNDVTHKLLKINTESLDNITLWACGLSDMNGEKQATLPTVNAGGASIITSANMDNSKTLTFNVRRFDDMEIGGDKIGLIKIDVEGHEAQALSGMTEMLKRDRPVIIFEHNNLDNTESSDNLISILNSFGYTDFYSTIRAASIIPQSLPRVFRAPLRLFERLIRPAMSSCELSKVQRFEQRNYPMVVAKFSKIFSEMQN